MSHTPGPWEVGYGGGITGPTASPLAYLADKCERQVVSAPGHNLPAKRCVCVLFDPKDSQQQANARLIAAAPEMLQALEYVVQVRKVECSAHPEGFDDICAYCKIRAAIAKATGGDL